MSNFSAMSWREALLKSMYILFNSMPLLIIKFVSDMWQVGSKVKNKQQKEYEENPSVYKHREKKRRNKQELTIQRHRHPIFICSIIILSRSHQTTRTTGLVGFLLC
jgi:hypothetical protein